MDEITGLDWALGFIVDSSTGCVNQEKEIF
jgi:hypothetical protein